MDGLKGFPQDIEAAFPQTRIQTCIVHLLRHSMNFASYKDRKAVAAALKAIYPAVDVEAQNWLWLSSRTAIWQGSIRRSRRAGAGPGTRSSRSSITRPRSAG